MRSSVEIGQRLCNHRSYIPITVLEFLTSVFAGKLLHLSICKKGTIIIPILIRIIGRNVWKAFSRVPSSQCMFKHDSNYH